MYVARVPNRGSPPAVLLRESYREDGKVKNRTLANLSRWPEEKVEALSAVLRGRPPKVALGANFEITRSLPHGHVAAVLGALRGLGLEELVDPVPSRVRDLVVAMVVAQVTEPSSKLACARGLRAGTASSSLGQVLGIAGANENDLYEAMDWLFSRQGRIEDALAARHLDGATLVLYDVSSAAFEGRTCPLGAIGHAKDGVHGRLQIVYGLLTSPDGIPVAIEVFAERLDLAPEAQAQLAHQLLVRGRRAPVDHTPLSELKDPATDESRAQKPEWLIVVGICTHLGCVPLGHQGKYEGWFCPCHGSVYDTAGRIRQGPPPKNLVLPPYKYTSNTKITIG